MANEQIRKIIDDSYDASKEESLLAIAGEFYSRRMLSITILMWVWGLLFIALAVYGAMQFFRAGETRAQILYAVLFVVGFDGVGQTKMMFGQLVHRQSIKRDLKRLELRVAELSEMLKIGNRLS